MLGVELGGQIIYQQATVTDLCFRVNIGFVPNAEQ